MLSGDCPAKLAKCCAREGGGRAGVGRRQGQGLAADQARGSGAPAPAPQSGPSAARRQAAGTATSKQGSAGPRPTPQLLYRCCTALLLYCCTAAVPPHLHKDAIQQLQALAVLGGEQRRVVGADPTHQLPQVGGRQALQGGRRDYH